jgi:hypothetical protein
VAKMLRSCYRMDSSGTSATSETLKDCRLVQELDSTGFSTIYSLACMATLIVAVSRLDSTGSLPRGVDSSGISCLIFDGAAGHPRLRHAADWA